MKMQKLLPDFKKFEILSQTYGFDNLLLVFKYDISDLIDLSFEMSRECIYFKNVWDIITIMCELGMFKSNRSGLKLRTVIKYKMLLYFIMNGYIFKLISKPRGFLVMV